MPDQIKAERGLPKVIRNDNGPEFAGRTLQAWAATNGVELRFIQPGKPVQNAYIESFNSRLRDECLSHTGLALDPTAPKLEVAYSHGLAGPSSEFSWEAGKWLSYATCRSYHS